MKLIKLFFLGLLISFLGSLPLGTLNVAAFQISVSDGIKTAFWFAFGCILIEILYVRISLVAMNKVIQYKKVIEQLNLFALGITVFLAVLSFFIAYKHVPQPKHLSLNEHINPFMLGVLMSAVNPAQIPFWFGFSTLLFSKKILLPVNIHYNWYIAGIAIGSIFASCIFILGGQLFLRKVSSNQTVISLFTGICFSITAAIQIWRLVMPSKAIKT